MTYKETLNYLFTQLPMFHRIGAAAYKSDLNTTIELNQAIGNPEKRFKSIHIAGTNGKGSCSSMLASVLQEAGYKVGLYTSPHLKDFRERIRINGEMISEDEVIAFIEQNKVLFEKLSPSFFEMTFALACDFFAKNAVDFAVMEVGMGGRLDSTNIVDSKLCLITNISFDHTAFLGDTLEKIAIEKAGIIKFGVPVVIGQRQSETENVFINTAKLLDAPIYFSDELIEIYKENSGNSNFQNFKVSNLYQVNEIRCPLLGNYQKLNIQSVLACVKVGVEQNIFRATSQEIASGILNVIENTGFAGRWQLLNTSPLTIADTAHNEDGLRLVLPQLLAIAAPFIHFVLGVVNDKAIDKILPLFPKNAFYYFCKPDIPRGLDSELLKIEASKFGLVGECYNSCQEALNAATFKASKDDLIYIGGSTFVVAELI